MAMQTVTAPVTPHRRRTTRLTWLCFTLMLSVSGLVGCAEKTAPDTLAVSINGYDFTLELALTEPVRFQGLSDRADIAADGGMLFAFSDATVRRFVMRRCLVPIDIVFVDASGRVTATHAMQVEDPDGSVPEASLKQYSSDYPAMVALEFQGGTLEKLDLSRGDPVDLPLADLKRWAQ